MMIDEVMYGMIDRAKMANWVSAPPENSWRKLSTPPCSACSRSCWIWLTSIPGTGMCDPSR